MKRLVIAFVLLLTSSLLAQQPVSVLGFSTPNTSDAAWTSATSNNTRVTLISNNGTFNAVLVTLVQGTTLTGGTGTFQQSNDNSNWVNVQCVALGTTTIAGPAYNFVASTNAMFMCPVSAPYFGFQLTSVIIGSGTVTVGHNALTLPSVALMAGTETLAAGTNVIGKAGIDQTTPGTTNAIESVPDTSSAVALSNSVKLTVTSSVNIKTSAGNVYGVSANNGAAAVCWVQFNNSAGAGTLGSAVIFSVVMPSSGTVNIPPGALALGNFSTGIAVGIASATNSSTACGTAGNITVFYK